MALSDLKVYSEYLYSSMSEVLAQQVELFNAATEGAIVLVPAAMQGDFSDLAFWQKISGLVRRRNAYGSGSVAAKDLKHIEDTMVKIAAGTPPINIDPGQFRWIQRSPKEAGVVIGQQLAKDVLADMLNLGLGACYTALATEGTNVHDATGGTDKKLSFANINLGQSKFGDAASNLAVWIMHSTPQFSLYGNALANAERLFAYSSVNVVRDPFGRLLVSTDSPNLVDVGSPNSTYHTLGLVRGAVTLQQNNDFEANEETSNGNENIQRTYQAEWSFNCGIQGFAWDKASGGKSPNDAAVLSGANWEKIVTSNKDLAGVIIETQNG
jgi:hypothetical protein